MRFSLLSVTLFVFGVFFGLPLCLGAYNDTWMYLHDSTPSYTTVLIATTVEFLIIYLGMILLKRVVRVCQNIRPRVLSFVFTWLSLLSASAFYVTSWATLYYYGCFFSARTLLAALTLDGQVNYHLNVAQLKLALGLSIAVAITAISLRYLIRFSDNKKEASRSAFYTLLAFCLLVATTISTDGARFFRLLRSTISPEVALIAEITTLGQEYFSTNKHASFAPIDNLERWKDQCIKDSDKCPDVVVVAVEALRHDVLSPENQPERIAPHLHTLSQKSQVFSRAYAVAPDTGYALEGILSGGYPYQSPLRHQNYSWDANVTPNLVDILKTAGYRTGYFGATNWSSTKRYVVRPSLDLFYDSCESELVEFSKKKLLGNSGQSEEQHPLLPHDLRTCDEKSVATFGEWFAERTSPQPSFSLIYLVSSHFPWYVPNPSDRIVQTEAAESPLPLMYHGADAGEYGSVALYKNAIHLVDTFLGRIATAVDSKREKRPVILIVLGDHGEALGEHNDVMHDSSLFEEQVRIPLLINGRGAQSTIHESLVSQVDVAPTILSLAGLPSFNGFQGHSLIGSPLKTSTNRPIFLTLQAIRSADALVDWPYKGIWNDDISKIAVYNLETDPHEKIDIASSAPDIAERLKNQIDRFRGLQRAYYLLPSHVRRQSAPPRQ